MAEIEKYGSVRRFGARYGRRLKERFGKIEIEQRKKQKCPYCSALKVKRIAVGIWECRKCKAKFSGKAYSVTKKIAFKEEKISPIEEKEKIKLSNDDAKGNSENLQKEVAQNG